MQVLLIEDHPHLASLVQQNLAAHGFRAHLLTHASHAREHLTDNPADAILLDRMLPDADGIELCRDWRAQGIATPILILSVRGSIADRVAGLEAGADDYLAKPFDLEELVARLRAAVRRHTPAPATHLRHADIQLDLLQRAVSRAGQPLELRRKELELLEFFLRHPNRLLTRPAIAQHVWDLNFNPSSNVIDVSVASLRKKIDRPFPDHPPLIHTVIGAGYIFGQHTEP